MKMYTRRGFTAAGLLATLGLAGCFNSSDNEPTAVYGPPNDVETSSGSASSADESSSSSSASASGDASNKSDDYDPSTNEPEVVYGPPDDFDPSDNEVEDVYGPPDVDPSEWPKP